MRTRGRVDNNQAAIVQALRKCGWKVASLANVGGGVPDLLAARGAEVMLVEVKQPKGTLTPAQQKFKAQGWPITVIRTVDEAAQL